jgi:branched-chain amino acid transport system ATP-binding protein
VLLKLNNVTVHYGKAEVVKGVTIGVTQGTIVGIIGSNGAGKSTVLKAVCGSVPISSGQIYFAGERIDKMSTHNLVKLGIVHVPENRHLFPYMTVLSNLEVGAYLRKDRTGIKKDLDDVFTRFPRLYERRNQQASTLSGGEQQMLAIGRGLMAKPRVLLLDEPSTGLAPLVVEQLGEAIGDLNRNGLTILLVEQNAHLVTAVAQRGYVLQVGKVVLEGNLAELMGEDLVQRAFLGG